MSKKIKGIINWIWCMFVNIIIDIIFLISGTFSISIRKMFIAKFYPSKDKIICLEQENKELKEKNYAMRNEINKYFSFEIEKKFPCFNDNFTFMGEKPIYWQKLKRDKERCEAALISIGSFCLGKSSIDRNGIIKIHSIINGGL